MKPAEKIAGVIRDVMVERAMAYWGKTVVIALSGGVDSCSALASYLEVGIRPVCVSYTPDTHESTDFKMARETCDNLDLHFRPAIVPMNARALENAARILIGHGWKSKVQVESLAPMLVISKVAAKAKGQVLVTGDQSDGFFSLSRMTAIRVRKDLTPEVIDSIRHSYWVNDKSCSEMVATLAAEEGMLGEFPYRDIRIARAFAGTIWRDINKPRVKEPIKLAWDDWFAKDKILVRPMQVNLHKGDSEFSNVMGATLLERFQNYRSVRGLFNAMARGEV